MTGLLHLDTSASPVSASRALAGIFRTAFAGENPGAAVVHRDLAADPVPHLGADGITADFTPAESQTPGQKAARALREELAAELESADALLISAPMYNWAVPSTLKAWIDQALIAGRTLTFGVPGPMAGKPAVIVLSYGGGYTPGAPQEKANHVEPYLKTVFADMLGMELTVITRQLAFAGVIPGLDHLVGVAEDSLAEAERAAEEAGRKTAAALR